MEEIDDLSDQDLSGKKDHPLRADALSEIFNLLRNPAEHAYRMRALGYMNAMTQAGVLKRVDVHRILTFMRAPEWLLEFDPHG
jgi:hypothetical protein